MKRFALLFIAIMLTSSQVLAAQMDWTNNPIANDIISTFIFSIIGIVMAFFSFKVWDMLTPGDLAKDIAHNNNIALAIVTASMMLGVCIIIASVLSS